MCAGHEIFELSKTNLSWPLILDMVNGSLLLMWGAIKRMAEYDDTAFNHEQGSRARKLFAAVVLAALDDAILDHRKFGNGDEVISRWARSRDGREVLTCAGIDPNERVVGGLMEFVKRGVRTSVALSREESERRNQQRARAA